MRKHHSVLCAPLPGIFSISLTPLRLGVWRLEIPGHETDLQGLVDGRDNADVDTGQEHEGDHPGANEPDEYSVIILSISI